MIDAKYANKILYTDVQAHEIVRQCTNRKIIVRRMKAISDPNWKREFVSGGFFGHTYNDAERKYTFEQDMSRSEVVIRLHKSGDWKDVHGNRYVLSNTPREYYDSNF